MPTRFGHPRHASCLATSFARSTAPAYIRRLGASTLPPMRVTVKVRWPRSRPRCSMSAPVATGPQPVEGEQGDQGVLGGRPKPGGDQQGAEFVAVQGGGMRLIIQPGTADVRGRGVVQELFFVGMTVEPGDGAQPPGYGGAGPPACFQFPGEGVDIGAADREQRQGTCPAPAGELAQVEGVGLAGQAAVPGQEPGERESLGVGEGRLGRDEGSRGGCGGHQAPPGTAGTWRAGAAAGPGGERCPQRTTPADDGLRYDP